MAAVEVFRRKYATGSGADIYVPMTKRAVQDFAVSADWTPAAGDVKVSIDGAAAANIATLPTAITMGNGAIWKFVFSNAELTGKVIAVTVADSATKAVEDQAFVIETYGNASALHPFDIDTATQSVSVGSGGITTASFAAGAINAAAVAADAIGASELAADAATEIATAVWAATMTELAAVPAVTGTTLAALEWLFLLSRNKVTQTSTTSTLRNNADGATVGTSTVSDDGTTFTRGKWS